MSSGEFRAGATEKLKNTPLIPSPSINQCDSATESVSRVRAVCVCVCESLKPH